jgi:hypothetical protein
MAAEQVAAGFGQGLVVMDFDSPQEGRPKRKLPKPEWDPDLWDEDDEQPEPEYGDFWPEHEDDGV